MPRPIVTTGVPIDCVNAVDPRTARRSAPNCPRPPCGTRGCPARSARRTRGDLDVRLVGRDRDPATGVLGWPSVLATTAGASASLVRDQIAAGRTAVPARRLLHAAARRAQRGPGRARRRSGSAYLDGHLDLYDGQTSETGEPADMPISVITGHGPAAWSAAIGAPLVARPELVLLGPRDRDEAVAYGCVLPEDAGLDTELTPAALRDRGLAAAGQAARDQLSAAAGRYWVHLDVDVLDELAFPATDYLHARRPVAGRARRAAAAAAGQPGAGRGVGGLLQPAEGRRRERRATGRPVPELFGALA